MHEDAHRSRERGPHERRRSPPRGQQHLPHNNDAYRMRQGNSHHELSYDDEEIRYRGRDWDRDRDRDRDRGRGGPYNHHHNHNHNHHNNSSNNSDHDPYYNGPAREVYEPGSGSRDQGGRGDDYLDRRDEDAEVLHPYDGDDRGPRHYDRGGRGYPRSHYDNGPRRDDARRGPDEDLRHFSTSPGGSTGHYSRRDRSASPLRQAGSPSDTVILEGLPPGLSLDHVRECLFRQADLSRYPTVDIRVPSGRGQRRAFVQFENVEDAVEFVKQNYPKLVLDFAGLVDGDADGMTSIYIHFARNRDDGERDNRAAGAANWTCPTCDFSNYSTRSRCKNCGGLPTDPSQYRHLLTGESDAAESSSQILVFFPLAPSVTEDVLAVGAAKLELAQKPTAPKNSGDPPKLKSTAPTGDAAGYGARPGSLHRIFLMRDQETNESFNFGFAEFWTVEDAQAAMQKFKMMREFTIASSPVTVSTIHLGVFVPELREPTRAIEHISFSPLLNPAIRVKYWEPHVFPSQKVVTESPPGGPSSNEGKSDANDESKKGKKRKAEGSSSSASNKKAVPMAGQMAFWQRRHDEIHEGKRAADATAADNGTDQRQSEERAPMKISLSGSSNTSSGGPIKISLTGASLSSVAAAPATSPPGSAALSAPASTTEGGSTDPSAVVVSYVDREKVCCLLCMMKYKSLDDLNTHEKSRNHKNAMADEDKVKAAKPRIAARDKRMAKQAEEGGGVGEGKTDDAVPQQQQYRDRAKERRQVFNQPSKPKPLVPPQGGGGGGGGKPAASGRKDERSTTAASARSPAADETTTPTPPLKSKGAGMLAKMGWSTGKGLGANGEGRTEVIATHAYQEGVGLGAEGGNLGDAAELAQRRTKGGYAEYVNTVQDRARERYNKMN